MLETFLRWAFPLIFNPFWNVLALVFWRKGTLPKVREGMACPYYGKCMGRTCSYAVAINRDNTVVNSPKWQSRGIPHLIWSTRMDCSAGRDGR